MGKIITAEKVDKDIRIDTIEKFSENTPEDYDENEVENLNLDSAQEHSTNQKFKIDPLRNENRARMDLYSENEDLIKKILGYMKSLFL